VVKVLALVLAFGTMIAACTLLADDPPKNSCESDFDCFTDREQCNLDAGVCDPKPDAAP
jgi:hypothetical protein